MKMMKSKLTEVIIDEKQNYVDANLPYLVEKYKSCTNPTLIKKTREDILEIVYDYNIEKDMRLKGIKRMKK